MKCGACPYPSPPGSRVRECRDALLRGPVAGPPGEAAPIPAPLGSLAAGGSLGSHPALELLTVRSLYKQKAEYELEMAKQ